MSEPRITTAVLKVLAEFVQSQRRELSGADVRRETGISTGTLYPILMRLERAGWLESRWEEIEPSEFGRPRKRLYKITGEGARRAEAAFAEIPDLGRRVVWA